MRGGGARREEEGAEEREGETEERFGSLGGLPLLPLPLPLPSLSIEESFCS